MVDDYSGPAFPGSVHPGMTLRDYFAAAAMQGLIAGGHLTSTNDEKWIVENAYCIADAMIVGRITNE